MATEREIQKLEKEIRSRMMLIKNKKTTPKESGIGKLFTILKKIDEVSYEKNLTDYKLIIRDL